MASGVDDAAVLEGDAVSEDMSNSEGDGQWQLNAPHSSVTRKYRTYLKRLWKETSHDARETLNRRKLVKAISTLEKALETKRVTFEDEEIVMNLRIGLTTALDQLDKVRPVANPDAPASTSTSPSPSCASAAVAVPEAGQVTKPKPRRSILFGGEGGPSKSIIPHIRMPNNLPLVASLIAVLMGIVVTIWCFSGNYIFTGLFTAMVLLGQLEYYRGVISTGVYPARKISVIGSCSMFLTALFFPNIHQLMLPCFATVAMIWMLTMKRNPSTISDIATTFTGMFYIGYMPSFWVKIRPMGAWREHTRVAHLVAPFLGLIGRKAQALPAWVPKTVPLPITQGAIFTFWCWICIAFADVGAYFTGKNLGKTKLGSISPAAGKTSPKKTVEGVIGGCITSGLLGALGAWVQRWPRWYITGMGHGVMLALLGLIGDLTASMLKRDAGLKDFGDLIPEHGGVLDRVDSFIFSAPYAYFVIRWCLPYWKAVL